MAIRVNNTTPAYLQCATLPSELANWPFTFFARFKARAGIRSPIISIGRTDTAYYQTFIGVRGDTTNTAELVSQQVAAWNTSASTKTYSDETWNQIGGSFDNTRRFSVLNGVKSAANTTTVANQSNRNRIWIGARVSSSPSYGAADICDVAVWTGYLDQPAWLRLLYGESPLSVDPKNLLLYWPLESVTDLESRGKYKTRLTVVGDVKTVPSPVKWGNQYRDDLLIGSTYPVVEEPPVVPSELLIPIAAYHYNHHLR